MRYFQFNNFSTVFFATVRVILHDGVTTTRTTIKAKTLRQAKLMLIRLYGEGNVLKLSQVMSEHEDIKEASKTLSPQELQVKSSSLKNSLSRQRQTHCALRVRFVDKNLSQLMANVTQTAGL